MRPRIRVDSRKLRPFCRRWKIRELAVFGSALRSDFGPQSDVDVLVTFAEDAAWSLFDHQQMEEELARILGRKVDLISRRAVERSENRIRRDAILGSAVPVYVAAG